MSVKDAFNKCATVYDQTRKKFIPCFDDFYGMAIALLPDTGEKPLKVLDLGAGTGLLSAMVLTRFPHSQIQLLDISDAMLAQARKRFANSDALLSFAVKNYALGLPEGSFDVIISALSIHHLDHEEKKQLFIRIHDRLTPGGIFINADQALGKSQAIDDHYREAWFKQIRQAGITEDELAQGVERMKEDKMSLLSDQLLWLEQAGFHDINCWYKYYNFVVYSGMRK